LEAERLRHVVVRSALEGRHRVTDGVPGGQDDDGQRAARGPQPVEDAEAVETRQADVQDHQVELPGHRIVERGDPVVNDRGGEAVRAQTFLHERGDSFLVLDDEDAVHASASMSFGTPTPDGSASSWRVGRVMVKTDPPLGCRATSTVPWC